MPKYHSKKCFYDERAHVTRCTTPHYKWRCKKMELRRCHNNSDVFCDKLLTRGMEISINMQFVHKTFSFRKHFGAVLREGIQTAKFCTEVFVMPKHLITKLFIPESSSYSSPLCIIVLSQQYCRKTVIW